MSLFWIFITPLIGASLIPFFKHRGLAVLFSLFPLAALLFSSIKPIHYTWFSPLSISFSLAIDPISFVFLLLTAIIIPLTLLICKPHLYSLILVLETLLIGFFASRDLVFFTIFWEAMLLPLYFLINLSNKPGNTRTSLVFLIYMFAGSILMIAGLIGIYLTHQNFDLEMLKKGAENPWVFGIFALAFAVKTPLFPFHAWLPETYNQSPTSGTILLSALLSKAGIYGFLRMGLESTFSYPLTLLAIIGTIYGGFAAYKQNNFKKIFAYSSFSHVNFILAGIFIMQHTAETGAILQAFNHGIIITGLFLASGWLETRLNSTSLSATGGLASYFPVLSIITFIFILASIALPITNGFIGELLILVGIFSISPWLAALLATNVIISPIYMLRFMQTAYFESPSAPLHQNDIEMKNICLVLPLILLIFWIGIYPTPLLNLIASTQESLL